MELIMNTDLAKVMPKSIEFNHEELKKELTARLDKYNNLVVTEDGISEAKKDRANLNKLRTALDDKRKEAKKDCLSPYEDFEKKVKEIIALVDKPILAIDSQVKAFDEQKKADKEQEISNYFAAEIGELADLLPLSKIWNPKWLNAGYKMDSIEKEITEAAFKAKNDIAIIKAMNLECEQQMLDVYLDKLDMSAAMAEKTRWEERQKQLKEYEERQKKSVQEKAKAAQNPPSQSYTRAGDPPYIEAAYREVEEPAQPQQNDKTEVTEEPKTISVTFEDTSESFRYELSRLCKQYGIKYRWAKKEDIK